MFRRFTRVIAAVTSVAVLGLVAAPGVVRAASIEITITGSEGGIARAMIAVLNSDGDAIDSAIADSTGKATIDDAGAASIIVAAPGYQTKVVSPVAAGSVTLTASTKSKLSFSNAYGGQVRTLAADAESGVFYATTDAQPSVWRTTDYAGTWAPVPTSAEDTEASATTPGGITQNQTAGEIFTSAAKGEVAVQVGNDLYFSRTYGNSWTKIASYSNVTGQNKKHFWVHGGASGDASIIFVRTDSGLFAAVMPDSTSDTAAPTFTNVSTALSYSALDSVAFAVGSTGNMYMLAANGSGVELSQLTLSGTTISASTPAQSHSTLTGKTLVTTGSSLLRLSTLGTASPKAVVLYNETGSTVSFSVGSFNGTTWDFSSAVKGANQSNETTLQTFTSLQGKCGQNGNTPLVGSIANDAPTGSEILTGAEVIGTIGQCTFVFNADGGALTFGSASLSNGDVAVLPMGGANNNTGFAWDSGFNFSNDPSTGNMVSISGDGKFGVRKSAVISSLTNFRPQFGESNPNTATLLSSIATPGKDTLSGGIAVNGMSGPNVTDVVYDPNSTDGSRLALSMTDTGGGRTMISTDGGASFSTLGGGGSRSLDWWNGANGLQHIAATFSLGSGYLQVKSFKTSTGQGALDMGEELAATAAVRDARDPAQRQLFAFGSAVTLSGGGQINESNFIPSGGQTLNTAIEGIVGKDMMLMAVNKCAQGSNVGPTGCEASAGTVGLVDLSVNSSSGAVTASSIKYFGTEVAEVGASSVSGNGTYTAGVNAIQYCPAGSATKVADTAFISVSGKGIYKITGVTSGPKHASTATTTGTYTEMKIDCDTGLVGVASTTGVFLSVDGGAKFFELKTSTQSAPSGPQPQGQGNTALALQADASTGDVTVAVASGNGDVKAIETTFTDMGLSPSAVVAGNAPTPSAAVTPKSGQINEVNSSANGKNTGQVPDLELPPASGDKVTASSVRALSTGVKLAVGSAGGAFRATVKTGTPSTGTPAAKTVSVRTKKTVTVASALKTLGITVVKKSKVVATSTTTKICQVVPGNKVKGVKKGTCKLTVKITPPKTKKVPKPKTTTKRIKITVT